MAGRHHYWKPKDLAQIDITNRSSSRSLLPHPNSGLSQQADRVGCVESVNGKDRTVNLVLWFHHGNEYKAERLRIPMHLLRWREHRWEFERKDDVVLSDDARLPDSCSHRLGQVREISRDGHYAQLVIEQPLSYDSAGATKTFYVNALSTDLTPAYYGFSQFSRDNDTHPHDPQEQDSASSPFGRRPQTLQDEDKDTTGSGRGGFSSGSFGSSRRSPFGSFGNSTAAPPPLTLSFSGTTGTRQGSWEGEDRADEKLYRDLAVKAAESRKVEASAIAKRAQLTCSQKSIQREVRRLIEHEEQEESEYGKVPLSVTPSTSKSPSPTPSLPGSPNKLDIFFRCPELLGDEAYTKEEMRNRMRDRFKEMMGEGPLRASAMWIHSLNSGYVEGKEGEKTVDYVVRYLGLFLENLIANPHEEKYRRIKMSALALQNILKSEGGPEFLTAVGFERAPDEDYMVFKESGDKGILEQAQAALCGCERVVLKVHRDPKVYPAGGAKAPEEELPDSFFEKSPDEVRAQQRAMSEALDEMKTLRLRNAKEMEEKQGMVRARGAKRSKYSLIRVNFPDGRALRGTFGVLESLDQVREFLDEHLTEEGKFCGFRLFGPVGSGKLDERKSLKDLGLCPKALLHLHWENSPKTPDYFNI